MSEVKPPIFFLKEGNEGHDERTIIDGLDAEDFCKMMEDYHNQFKPSDEEIEKMAETATCEAGFLKDNMKLAFKIGAESVRDKIFK